MRRRGGGLRIAMLGQKGFPAAWGGVELHVTEISGGLARRGHEVTVFVRPWYQREVVARDLAFPSGVRVRQVLSVPTKHLDAITHVLVGTLAARRGFDILHYHGIGPGSALGLARAVAPGPAKVLTVHALDWKRARWSAAAKRLLRLCEAVAVRCADGIIAVSHGLERYLEARYGASATVIPSGVRPARFVPPGPCIANLGLSPRRYLLFVGRLVLEKGARQLVEAFRRVPGDWRLVLVGPAQDARYSREIEELARADPRVVLSGAVHGDALRELYSNAGAFVLPSLLEGMPLAFLEALSYGLPVVASDLEEVREAVSSFGAEPLVLFEPGDVEALAACLCRVIAASAAGQEVVGPGRFPSSLPSWEVAVSGIERFYKQLLR